MLLFIVSAPSMMLAALIVSNAEFPSLELKIDESSIFFIMFTAFFFSSWSSSSYSSSSETSVGSGAGVTSLSVI